MKITGGSPALNSVLTSDANGLANWQSPAGGGWSDDGTVVRLSTSTDKVGIGTTNPTAPLVIESDGSTFSNVASVALGIRPSSDDMDASISLITTRTATDREWNIRAGSGGPNSNFRIFDATASADRFNIDSSGNVGIGTTAPNSNAILDASSTTKGFMLPRWTTAQETTNVAGLGAGDEGLMWFNTTTKQFMGWNGTAKIILG